MGFQNGLQAYNSGQHVLNNISGYHLDTAGAYGFNNEAILRDGSGVVTAHFYDFRQEPEFNWGLSYFPIQENTGILAPNFVHNDASGINKKYPHPDDFAIGNLQIPILGGSIVDFPIPYESGLLYTYGPTNRHPITDENQSTGSGLFHYYGSNLGERTLNGLISNFSKPGSVSDGIQDYEIFNDYIHYLPYEEAEDDEEEGDTTPVIPGVTDGTDDDLEVRIPFVADFTATDKVFNKYPRRKKVDP
tara:strand:+ start:821 stop:1558 length:738 start_codon:yes stop_codon:yes gene_type:complete